MGWNLNTNYKRFLIFLIAFLPIFGVSAILVANSLDLPNNDSFTFWLAGRMLWTNQNPYISEQWVSGHFQYGASWIPNAIFPYPLPLAIVFAPLGLFSLQQAYMIWFVFSEIAIVVSIFLLLDTAENSKKIHLAFPLVAAAFIFRPTLVTLRDGQLGAFLLFVLSLAIILWRRCKYWQSAILISFLLLKPTIGVPIIAILCLWLFLQKNFKTILTLIGSGLVWILIGLFMDLNWIPKFLLNGSKKFYSTLELFPNFWGISNRMCDGELNCTYWTGTILGLILLALLVFVFAHYQKISIFHLFSIIISASLLVTPYIWAYDHVLLIIPVLYVTIVLFDRGYRYLLVSLFPIMISILSLIFLYIAMILNRDTWSFMMPLICLALTLVLLKTPKASPSKYLQYADGE